jgi:hypothetical protein
VRAHQQDDSVAVLSRVVAGSSWAAQWSNVAGMSLASQNVHVSSFAMRSIFHLLIHPPGSSMVKETQEASEKSWLEVMVTDLKFARARMEKRISTEEHSRGF